MEDPTINHVFVWFIVINLAITLHSIQTNQKVIKSNEKVTNMMIWAHIDEIEKNRGKYGGLDIPFDPPDTYISAHNPRTGDTGDDSGR